MKASLKILPGILGCTLALLAGCGGGGSTSTGGGSGGSGGGSNTQTATPTITASAAQNGAQIVTLADSQSGAKIYYTVDGSTPTISSQVYEAPFLVASSETVQAIAQSAGDTASAAASQSFSISLASGTLVWSDEFDNSTGANAQPDSSVWTYDTGAGGWGNGELEDYCAWGSNASPCNSSQPNAYVDTSGYLHVVAEEPSSGVYTSARLKTEGLFGFQYGRIEVRAQAPEEQGLWPAFWMLGSNYPTVNWPACGEMDVLERVNAASTPDWNEGSIHGPGFTGSNLGTVYDFPSGQTAAGWHTYGMIWKPGSISYYVDDPTQPYVTYTPSSLNSFSGASWPFDNGQNAFLILNLAVGGSWPGSPNAGTAFPAQILVDYVRIYTN